MSKVTKLEKYGASWCGPCKILDNALKEITDVEIVKHDADEEPDLFNELGIRSVPTLIFRDEEGNELERTFGAIPVHNIEKIIAKYKYQ
jgi:thioredoxin 1